METETKKETTIEQVVDRELAGVNIQAELPNGTGLALTDYREVHKAKLAALKVEVEALPEVSDKKTYEANNAYRNKLVKTRTGIDKARKAIIDPMKQRIEMVNAYLGTTADNGLQMHVKELERVVEKKLAAWDEEQARIEAEARRVIQARYEHRAGRLSGLGCNYTGQGFSLDGLMVWDVDVRNTSDELFERLIEDSIRPKAKALAEAAEAEAEAAQEAHEAEQRRKEEEAEAMRREFERQAAEQKRLDDERAALDRERAEIAAERAKLAAEQKRKEEEAEEHRKDALQDARWALLKDLGASRDDEGVWTYGAAVVTDHQLRTMTDEQFTAVLDEFKDNYIPPSEAERVVGEAISDIRVRELADEEGLSMDAQADRALSNSSGIYESPDEKLVRETEEVLEVITTDREMMKSMATKLEAELQSAVRMAGDATTFVAEATWSIVVDKLEECISALRNGAEKK
jgi:hypothetical protein